MEKNPKNINDVCILVQARLGSQRVPGKMLRPFAGTTLVDILFKKFLLIWKLMPTEKKKKPEENTW